MQVNPKLFVSLSAAALLSLAAAGAVYVSGNRWEAGELAGAAAFPVLEKRINDVVSLQITQGGGKLEFVRDGGVWKAAEPYGGYELAANRVDPLIVRLSQADLIEPKTRDPEKYELLDLGDPDVKDSKARRIVMRDADGAVILETVLGSKRWDAFGAGKSGSYIRKPGEERTWLANLDINPTIEIEDWVEADFFAIDEATVSAVTVVHEGQEPLRIVRASGEEPAFELAGLPPESKRKESGPKPEDVVDGYGSIALEDLRKLNATPAGANVVTSTLKTNDGLTVTFWLRGEGDEDWVSLSAEGTGEAKKRAEEINARVKGWEYEIPSWKADKLFRSRSDFIETS